MASLTRRLWPCDEDFELRLGRRVVAAIATVGDEAGEARSDLRLDLGQDGRKRVAIIRVARHRLHMGDELAAVRAMKRRGERDLTPNS